MQESAICLKLLLIFSKKQRQWKQKDVYARDQYYTIVLLWVCFST